MDQDAGLPSMDGWNVKILFSDYDVGRVMEVVLWVVWPVHVLCPSTQLETKFIIT